MEKLKTAIWFGKEEPSESELQNIKLMGYEINNTNVKFGTMIFGILPKIYETYSDACYTFNTIGKNFISFDKEIQAVFGDMPMVLYPLLNKRYSKSIPFFQKEDDIFLLSGSIPKGEQK